MTKKEQRYLEDKLALIQAVVIGSLWGAYMWPPKDGQFGEIARHQTEVAMQQIEKDVKNIYKYAKRNSKGK